MKNKKQLIEELEARAQGIQDPSLREFVQRMLEIAPGAFYNLPTTKGVHPKDEHGKHGVLLHTIRVVDLALIIADAADMSVEDRDNLTAAAILHDTCYYGPLGESPTPMIEHHLLVRKMAELLGKFLDYSPFERVFEIIETHMGRRFEPPFTPTVSLKGALHLADCICSVWSGKAPYQRRR